MGAAIYPLKEAALGLASSNGHLEIVKHLVENGSDTYDLKNFPLDLAVSNGHLEIVKYLVETGADIYDSNDFAVRYAAKYDHLDIVRYLLEQGVDPYSFSIEEFNSIKNLEIKDEILLYRSKLTREEYAQLKDARAKAAERGVVEPEALQRAILGECGDLWAKLRSVRS